MRKQVRNLRGPAAVTLIDFRKTTGITGKGEIGVEPEDSP